VDGDGRGADQRAPGAGSHLGARAPASEVRDCKGREKSPPARRAGEGARYSPSEESDASGNGALNVPIAGSGGRQFGDRDPTSSRRRHRVPRIVPEVDRALGMTFGSSRPVAVHIQRRSAGSSDEREVRPGADRRGVSEL